MFSIQNNLMFFHVLLKKGGKEKNAIHIYVMLHFFFVVHNRQVPFDKQQSLRKMVKQDYILQMAILRLVS